MLVLPTARCAVQVQPWLVAAFNRYDQAICVGGEVTALTDLQYQRSGEIPCEFGPDLPVHRVPRDQIEDFIVWKVRSQREDVWMLHDRHGVDHSDGAQGKQTEPAHQGTGCDNCCGHDHRARCDLSHVCKRAP